MNGRREGRNLGNTDNKENEKEEEKRVNREWAESIKFGS